MQWTRARRFEFFWLLVVLVSATVGCGQQEHRRVVTIWHQSRPAERELLADEIARFEAAHPDIHVRALYKETEELRAGFQAAALAGGGPELIRSEERRVGKGWREGRQAVT